MSRALLLLGRGLLGFLVFGAVSCCLLSVLCIFGGFLRVARGFLALLVLAAVGVGLFGGIIGYVPAGAFKLDGRRGNEGVHLAATMRALFQVRTGYAFNLFGFAAAFDTFVLVQGHSDAPLVSRNEKVYHAEARAPVWLTVLD